MSELTDLQREVSRLSDEVLKLRRVIVGNGEYNTSILARMLLLETRQKGWQWVVDKFGAPAITGVIIGIIMYVLYGAP